MTDHTSVVYIEKETELLWPIYRVWFVMKIGQDNDVTKWTSTLFAKNDIKKSSMIESGAICDKNQIGQ